MPLPFTTTEVTVSRQESTDPEGLEDLDSETDYTPSEAPWTIVTSGLGVVIGRPSGSRAFGPGGEAQRETYSFKANVPGDGNTILGDDEMTNELGHVYHVLWTRERSAIGLTFIEGECYQKVGED